MSKKQYLSWPVVILLLCSIAAMLFSAFSFVRSHQTYSEASVQIRSVMSQQVLAERLLNLAEDRSRQSELVPAIEAFDALQGPSTSADIVTTWQDFHRLLPDPRSLDADSASELPDFAPLVELTDALVTWLDKTEAPVVQQESAVHLFQLAGSVETRLQQQVPGSEQTLSARGPWLVFEQIPV